MLALACAGSAARAADTVPMTIADVRMLKTGQSLWKENDARGEVEIVISLPMQRMFVYRGGTLIAATTVSSGTRAKPTPTGEFTILEKDVFHRSNLYSDAPMPFMQRLTWDGIAIHAGDLPGHPASHGCIRMPRKFAERLYGLTNLDTRVLVTDQGAPENYVPPPPPELHPDFARLLQDRYAVVTSGGELYAPPGVTVFATSRPVLQPLEH